MQIFCRTGRTLSIVRDARPGNIRYPKYEIPSKRLMNRINFVQMESQILIMWSVAKISTR